MSWGCERPCPTSGKSFACKGGAGDSACQLCLRSVFSHRQGALPWLIIICGWRPHMFLVHWIVNWLLSALALWLVAQIIPGIQIRNFKTALLATVVIALVDITIGPILRFIAFPITFLTLGLFRLVLKADRKSTRLNSSHANI